MKFNLTAPLNPCGISCLRSGKLIVSCRDSHGIYSVNPSSGETVRIAGSSDGKSGSANGALSDAKFYGPSGLYVDESEECCYVCDFNNNSIRRVPLPHELFVTAGITAHGKPLGLFWRVIDSSACHT